MSITSIIEIAVFSGTVSNSASWLIISFSSSSSTPSEVAISTAQAKAVRRRSEGSAAADFSTKLPGPSFLRMRKSLSKSLSKADPE